jgi:hypothetical protein
MRLGAGSYRIRALRASVVNRRRTVACVRLHHGVTEVTEENDEVVALAHADSVSSVSPW